MKFSNVRWTQHSQGPDFLKPVALHQQTLGYPEIAGVKPEILFPLMRRGAAVYRDKQYQAMMTKLPDPDPADRSRLLRPISQAEKPAAKREQISISYLQFRR